MRDRFLGVIIFFISVIWTGIGQCSFEYISNDTIYQDYIEFISASQNEDKIIAIGSRLTRSTQNELQFNAPVFQIFDDCGNLISKTVYKYIGNYRIKHERLPYHHTYLEEPIGNRVASLEDGKLLIVDKAIDTITKKQGVLLFDVNEMGEVINYGWKNLTNQELNQNQIKNVIQLRDSRILVILWDDGFNYVFYYFDPNFNFLYKKNHNLGRGIRAIKELDNESFVCTSLAYDNSSFQFYKLDTNGEINWVVTPYEGFGSARDIVILNNKMHIVGGTQSFGVFLISDLEGNIIKEFTYNKFYCRQRFCSALINSDNSYIIAGYIQNCDASDVKGQDICLLEIDSLGEIKHSKTYNFKSALGTSNLSDRGYFSDYGGFHITKSRIGGIVTSGMTHYSGLIPGAVLHEDCTLINSNFVLTNTKNVIQQTDSLNVHFVLQGNPISHYLNLTGPIELIRDWNVYDINGKRFVNGNKWFNPLNTKLNSSGLYLLIVTDCYNRKFSFKFIKS